MRIVIDAQALQTGSEVRGIGRYVRGFIDGLIKNKSGNEIFIVINQNLKQSAARIINYFKPNIGIDHFIFLSLPEGIKWSTGDTQSQIDAGLIYQYAVLSTNPDVYVTGSVFEGFSDEFALSVDIIKKNCVTAAVLHDFIPLDYPDLYLGNKTVADWYENRFQELGNFDCLLAVSEYTADQAKKRFPDKNVFKISAVADEKFGRTINYTVKVNKILKKIKGKPFVYGGGGLDERKNWTSLVEAYAQLPVTIRDQFPLVLSYGRHDVVWEKIIQIAKNKGLTENQFLLLGRVTDEELIELYSRCYVFVFPSLSEGFGLPILEAMKCGAAVLTSNCTSMPEVIGLDAATFNPQSIVDIKDKLLQVFSDNEFYNMLREHSKVQASKFSWEITSRGFYSIDWDRLKSRKNIVPRNSSLLDELLRKISQNKHSEIQRISLSKNISKTFCNYKRKIYFDISILNRNDAGTGIQRVTRSILANAIKNAPVGYEVIAMYEEDGVYKYANDYMEGKLNKMPISGVLSFFPGDIVINTELNVTRSENLRANLRANGAKIYGVIHDLMPIRYPEFCTEGNVKKFPEYLKVISNYDGIIAVSQSVLEDYKRWRLDNNFSNSNILLDWFHLGSDIEGSVPSKSLFEKLLYPSGAGMINFICVSTIEPRKGYSQILDAFDLLWASKSNVSLTIVGREGWNVSEIIKRIKTHNELGKRLFWYPGISDYSLIELYNRADAVVFASVAEGFGLAVVEGARYKKPLILRDIPVFREIAKENAHYFSGLMGSDLAESIEAWIKLFREGEAPKSENIELLSWSDSTRIFFNKLGLV